MTGSAINKVCVVGAGTMGSQIAIVFARAGLATGLVDADPDALERGTRSIEAFLKKLEAKGKLEPGQAVRTLARLEPTEDLSSGVAGAGLVLEAVFEDMAVKKEVFARLDQLAPEPAILASNTSTLWVSELAAATERPEQCIGAHFLIPAALTPLVEVVRGVETSDETHAALVEVLAACGKETVTVADSPGFVINRLYLPLVNEAFFALEAGLATPEEIDRAAVRGLAFPLGPLAAADAFGLDILLACMQTFHRELGEKYRPAPLLVKLVGAGRLGKKTGQGVYDYRK